jgi:hypothetical protein
MATSAFNASSDVRQSSRGRSGCAPGTVREDAKNAFYRTRHLWVFLGFQRSDGPRLVSDGARFSFRQSIVLTHVSCSVPVRGSPWCRGRSAARARMVRA